MSLGVYYWSYLIVDYDVLNVPTTYVDGNKLYGNNANVNNSILYGLNQSEIINFMHCKSTKEVWVKLNQRHEADDKLEQAKIQTFRMRFESLIMSEEEIILKQFLRVDEVTNMIRELVEEVKEDMIFQNILRSLPMIFNAKVSTIEEWLIETNPS